MKKNELSLGYKLNNPFNIRYNYLNEWVGQLPPIHGFCHFVSLEYGVRAFSLLYHTYINKYHCTVRQFVHRFAPPTENDTNAYLRTIFRLTSFPPGYCLTSHDLVRFGSAVLQVEQGSARADVVALLKLF